MSSKDLIIKEISNSPLVKKEYKTMLDNIHNTLPAIKQSSSNFYKSHSQFMGVMLDVTAITPIRSIKHTLAEIDKTKVALEEGHISLQKKDIELREKEHKLKTDLDITTFEKELLETEILEIQVGMNNTQNSILGAIRKMNFFTNQYKSILKKLGKEDITEEEYEKEEANYHVMTCMKQALSAARSRGGVIDEGNLIYLFDMGINSAVAQQEILAYLQKENDMITNGGTPTHEMTMQWLEHCVERFKGDSNAFAERRGFQLKDTKSLNLIENKEKENKDGEQNNQV